MPGQDTKNTFVYALKCSFLTRLQDAKVLLGTVLLLSQLITNREFPFFSGINHCAQKELLLLDTTVHHDCV